MRVGITGATGLLGANVAAEGLGPAPLPWVATTPAPGTTVCGARTDPVDLQAAIDAAEPGARIDVCPGTYGPITVRWGQQVEIVASSTTWCGATTRRRGCGSCGRARTSGRRAGRRRPGPPSSPTTSCSGACTRWGWRRSVVQLQTPDELRGRVSAVNLVFIGASNELGEFESGLTARLFGAVRAVVFGGVGTLAVVATWAVVFPELRTADRLEVRRPG